jgi:hypothetical protein
MVKKRIVGIRLQIILTERHHINVIKDGSNIIHNVVHTHKDSLEVYESHMQTLSWRHSPYNPDLHREWAERLCV